MAAPRPSFLQRLLSTDRRALAAAVAGTVLLGALAVPAFAQDAPNPTPGATPVVARVFAGDPELRVWTGNVTTGRAYDLTVTNVSGDEHNLSVNSPVALRSPNGTAVSVATAYNDFQDGAGYLNVTFGNVTFSVAGNWSVTGGSLNKTLRVQAPPATVVTVSPSTIPVGTPQTLTMQVTVGGAPAPGRALRLCGSPIGGCTTDVHSDGQGRAAMGVNPQSAGSIVVHLNGTATNATVAVVDQQPVLFVRNATTGVGQTTRVPVTLHDVTDLGSLTFVLAWDPDVVTVDAVEAGGVPGANSSWTVNATNGTLRMVLATGAIPGPTGVFDVAYATLRAVGPIGSTSPLALGVEEAVRSDGSAIQVQARHGTFRSGLLGDADGDGDVDLDDVGAILGAASGAGATPFFPANADVNADGRATGADAMFVSQLVSGARGSFPAEG